MGNTVTSLPPHFARAVGTMLALTVATTATAGCSPGKAPAESSASTASSSADSVVGTTPVHMATVQRGNVALTVSGPGRTDALDLQKIHAPFTGTLTSLRIVVGDHVGGGQVIGSIVAQPSEAAVSGAQAMVSSATTPTQRSDAARALELARQNLVEMPLRTSRAGTVISRGASQGDLVSAGDSIASIAATGSITFVARIAQGDLTHVRPGQHATITLAGQANPINGLVHGLLPADTSGVTVPVRIDLQGAPRSAGAAIQTGLFGTAQIIVGEHMGVSIVPVAAVLRDDITGVSQVALVAAGNKAHWVTVTTGATEGAMIEIVSPALAPGQRVIVSGQVGLPEGSGVSEAAGAAASTSHTAP